MADAPFIPYGRQEINADDIEAVTSALQSAWLTTGPLVEAFEATFSRFCGAAQGVAVNSGTAALHAAMRAAGVGAGDEVIVPAITFAASANSAVYQGATPVFADVEADTLLIDLADAGRRVTSRTKAIVAVDYGGQPADYDGVRGLADKHGLFVIADACHAPGAVYKGRPVGTLADVSTFSFHPVKHLTTCEGGMALTHNADWAAIMRRFRNHGIDSDHRVRQAKGTFAYDVVELGYNYRLPDVQCALGIAQVARLAGWVERRQAVAALYDERLRGVDFITPLTTRPDRTNAHHLYVVRLRLEALKIDRARAFAHLRERGIGANIHYSPVYLHSFYRERFGYGPGLCPTAEAAYEDILTLPMFPGLTEQEVDRVVAALRELPTLS